MSTDTPTPEEEARAVFTIRHLVKTLTGQELSEDEARKLFTQTKEKMVDAMARANVENVDQP